MNQASHVWHNGQFKPWEEATVHVSAHALHYGSSVFEGERVYATPQGPAFFRLAEHTARLFESARMYEIDIGYSEEEINTACLELVALNRMKSAYVRPIAFRGAAGLGPRVEGQCQQHDGEGQQVHHAAAHVRRGVSAPGTIRRPRARRTRAGWTGFRHAAIPAGPRPEHGRLRLC